MRHTILTLAIASLIATSASAQNSPWSCNSNGAVLKLSEDETIYLGKSCDAAHSDGRVGRWWFTASAFAVQLGDETAKLYRFDIECDVPYCLFED